MLDNNGNVVGTSKVAARHVCSHPLLILQVPNKVFKSSFLPFETGTFRNSPDQSGPPDAHSGAASHDHGCSGEVRGCSIFLF